MPIAIRTDERTTMLSEEEFADESELQGYLERCPSLLTSGLEPEVVTVKSEVSLPAAGRLDLLLVDQEGVPIAVEVKLARNSQSRREVVAQAFDYLSDLNQLTVDELDDLVEGMLMGTLVELEERTGAEDLRKRCGTNLRAGQIRLVMAVDEARDDLARIVQYINDHSDLDVRLVAVSKFDGGTILVPRILVSGGGGGRLVSRVSARRRDRDPVFEDVVEVYNRDALEGLRTIGGGRTYRHIRPREWPDWLFYEIHNCDDDEIGIELHLMHRQNEERRRLESLLDSLSGTELVPGTLVGWNPLASSNRGLLMARIGKGQRPSFVAQAMHKLISLTYDLIGRELETAT